MDRFLIEVPHEEDVVACARVVQTFLQTGSHYLTNADWGCKDGDHRAWLIVDATDKEEARMIVPPPHRELAKVVQLNKFTMEEVDEILASHTE
jgi:hypothetical protein